MTKAVNNDIGLFDAEYLPVTQVGTSYSTPELFNFSGFLSDDLDLPVFPLAIPSGQLLSAIQEFFINPEYHDLRSKTKFLVWELPFLYMQISTDNEPLQHAYEEIITTSFRQMIPSAIGTCAEGETLLSQHASINAENSVLMTNADTSIMGSDYYLAIEIEDKTFVEFNLTFKYQDNSQEVLTIKRTTRVGNLGQFFIELSNTITSPLLQVIVSTKKMPTGNL